MAHWGRSAAADAVHSLSAAINSEVTRLERFERTLPPHLLHVRNSLRAFIQSPIELPPSRLDQIVGAATRLRIALATWVEGLDSQERILILSTVSGAVESLHSAMDLLPALIQGDPVEMESGAAHSKPDPVVFHRLAEDYLKDARNDRSTMSLLYCGSIVFFGLAAVASIWSATVGTKDPVVVSDQLLARVSAVVVLLLAAVTMAWQAGRHRRIGAEQLRLARQLRTFPAYISSIDSGKLKDLMRGALAPRFFSRTLDDDDVLREPSWPSPADLRPMIGMTSAAPQPSAARSSGPEPGPAGRTTRKRSSRSQDLGSADET
jgi:hypothetical protein